MSEHRDSNHATVQVLRSQHADLCRRLEEIRADVRVEQAETRQGMSTGFARIDARYQELEVRVRDVEREQHAAKERMGTWRTVVPILAGIAAGLGSWAKDLIMILLR